MANRVIKESIKRSPQIDSLTWFEEVVFYRLIVTADDYGCIDGRPVVLKSDLFPTKESVTKKAVTDAISKLAKCGLVIPYESDGIPYLYLTSWNKHQRLRNSRHKYPMPSQETLDFLSPQFAANCGSAPPESESENESDSQSNPNPNRSAEPPAAPAPEPMEQPVFQMPLHTGELWPITRTMISHWRELYPSVNVEQEIRKMIGWCEANPQKCKTARGVQRFITGWLAREQDRGGKHGYSSGSAAGESQSGTGRGRFAERLEQRKKEGKF